MKPHNIYMKTFTTTYIGYYHKNRNLYCKPFISDKLPKTAAEWIESRSPIASDLLKLIRRHRAIQKNGGGFGRNYQELLSLRDERDRLRQAFAHQADEDKNYMLLVAIDNYHEYI